MPAMTDRRFGVWFSVALVILALSAWLGSMLGARAALYLYRSAQRSSLGSLSSAEHARLENVLDELETIGFFRVTFLVSINNDKLKQDPSKRVGQFEDFGRRLRAAEAKPVFNMNLALANVVAAIADEQSKNNERAASHMRSAQSLYQSLGWRDYSEGTLRVVAEHELDKWRLQPQGREGAK
jgi:hypothetical protein